MKWDPGTPRAVVLKRQDTHPPLGGSPQQLPRAPSPETGTLEVGMGPRILDLQRTPHHCRCDPGARPSLQRTPEYLRERSPLPFLGSVTNGPPATADSHGNPHRWVFTAVLGVSEVGCRAKAAAGPEAMPRVVALDPSFLQSPVHRGLLPLPAAPLCLPQSGCVLVCAVGGTAGPTGPGMCLNSCGLAHV